MSATRIVLGSGEVSEVAALLGVTANQWEPAGDHGCSGQARRVVVRGVIIFTDRAWDTHFVLVPRRHPRRQEIAAAAGLSGASFRNFLRATD